jgi:membrane-bound metal-dependent hydrolase YbcI (DUF457 family)
MASYRGHLAFASMLGAGYGAYATWAWNADWGLAFLGATLTTVGGLLPDLDSDSGVPVRELFSGAASVGCILAYRQLNFAGFTHEQALVLLIGLYLFIRYGLGSVFKRWTVHRGMFHSIPALLIAGLATYLLFQGDSQRDRYYLAGAVMLGFLSHLVLDELYSVDFLGFRIKLNKYAGSALKLASSSWGATLSTYAILGLLGYLVWREQAP